MRLFNRLGHSKFQVAVMRYIVNDNLSIVSFIEVLEERVQTRQNKNALHKKPDSLLYRDARNRQHFSFPRRPKYCDLH